MAGIKDKRFKEMIETGDLMMAEVEVFKKLLQPYMVFSDKKLFSYILGFLKLKISNKPLRAYFSRKLYEYISFDKRKGKNDIEISSKKRQLFFIKLPFIFEVLIVIQYLHNHILDDKNDVRKGQSEKVNQNLISSNILREILFLYLHKEIKPLLDDENHVFEIHQLLSNLFLYVDLGQRIEKEYNTYVKWIRPSEFPDLIIDRYLFPSFVESCIRPFIEGVKEQVSRKNTFIEAYFQRIYLTNVYFFECITEIVMVAEAYRGIEKENLRRFSVLYGYLLQIINDYADFAYSPDEKERETLKTASKKSTDFFADLYNFNITLPLIYHLDEGSRRKIEAYLEGGRKRKKILNQYPVQIVNEIRQSGAIRKCIELTRELSKSAKICLDEQNEMTPYFNNMCDIANGNKFYKIFI